jgi:hypothetical protein
MPAKPKSPLDRLREIIGAWPETNEKISHGTPTWWGGRKTFATLHPDHHGEGRLGVWIKSTHEEQAELVENDPDRFFVPPYVGVSGWVGVRLDRRPTKADWATVAALLEQGYRSVAPKRAIAQLDGESKP